MKKSKLFFTLLVSMIGFSGAISAFGAEKDPPEIAALRAKAEAQDAQAQMDLGKKLGRTPEGESWIRKAADNNLGEAWFWMYYTGTGYASSPKDTPRAEAVRKAVDCLKKSADLGYGPAYPYLFDHLLFRALNSADVVTAKKYADFARQKQLKLGYFDERAYSTIDYCFAAGNATAPLDDQPSAEEKVFFKSKQCLVYRYSPKLKDLAKYRKCLLSSDGEDNKELAEVYANGLGVTRSYLLATAFACHAGDVPAELQYIVEFLHAETPEEPAPAGKPQASDGSEFNWCDWAAGNYSMSICLGRDNLIKKIRQEKFNTKGY